MSDDKPRHPVTGKYVSGGHHEAAADATRGALWELIAEALTTEHYRRAREQIVASPEEHSAGNANVVTALVWPELERRDAEIERLRAELACLKDSYGEACTELLARTQAIARVRAALERERAGARRIVYEDRDIDGTWTVVMHVCAVALTALDRPKATPPARSGTTTP